MKDLLKTIEHKRNKERLAEEGAPVKLHLELWLGEYRAKIAGRYYINGRHNQYLNLRGKGAAYDKLKRIENC